MSMAMGIDTLMQLLGSMGTNMGSQAAINAAQAGGAIDPAALASSLGGMAQGGATPGMAPSLQGAAGGGGAGMPGTIPAAAAPGMAPPAGVQQGATPGMAQAPAMSPYGTPPAAPAAQPLSPMPAQNASAQGAAVDMPEAGGQGGPGAMPGTPGAEQPSAWDTFMQHTFGGGLDKSPEGMDKYRQQLAMMSAGTALGGAIAGPGTTVGDASGALNKFAQGGIISSNAEQQGKGINDLAKASLGATQPGGAPQGGAPSVAPSARGGSSLNTPVTAPGGATQAQGPAFGGVSPQTSQTLSLDDLEKNLAALNISF